VNVVVDGGISPAGRRWWRGPVFAQPWRDELDQGWTEPASRQAWARRGRLSEACRCLLRRDANSRAAARRVDV
jgi:hypothetical protein